MATITIAERIHRQGNLGWLIRLTQSGPEAPIVNEAHPPDGGPPRGEYWSLEAAKFAIDDWFMRQGHVCDHSCMRWTR